MSTEAARLSKMLFLARENVAMWADVVEARYTTPEGQPVIAAAQRDLIDQIDGYRLERGWSPHGFGDEL